MWLPDSTLNTSHPGVEMGLRTVVSPARGRGAPRLTYSLNLERDGIRWGVSVVLSPVRIGDAEIVRWPEKAAKSKIMDIVKYICVTVVILILMYLLPEVELTSELVTLVFEVTVLLLLVLCQILH